MQFNILFKQFIKKFILVFLVYSSISIVLDMILKLNKETFLSQKYFNNLIINAALFSVLIAVLLVSKQQRKN